MKIDLQKISKNRILISEVFKSKKNKVEVAGWVHNTRGLGKIRFLLLRDISGIVQIVGVKGEISDEIFKIIDSVSRESVVYVSGSVKESKQAPGGKEIIPDEIIVLNSAEELPIDISDFSKTEMPKRLDYRFLDLHRQRTQAIFKIQNEITKSFREFFYDEGFLEMQPPCIISSSSEGGTELFPVKYFEKNAYLAQSPQLYKQMLACSVEKVVLITPVWRAEKHNTTRHVNELRQMDIEMAFADEFVVMEILAKAIQHIISNVIENNSEELKLLGVDLKIPKVKYLRFEEVNELMKKDKIKTEEDDLSGDVEKKLGELFPDTLVFVHDWPLAGKPFYIMPKGEKLSCGFDLIYRGMEIVSGGQRVHLPELLTERLKAKGLNPKDFKSYIDSFRYGAPPHAGWSLGLERITQLLCGLENVKEATMFPRDRDRLTP